MADTPPTPPDRRTRSLALRALKDRYRQTRQGLREQAKAARADYVLRRDELCGVQQKASYCLGEEIASAVTHGVGTLLAVAALAVMVVVAARSGDPWRIVSAALYGATLVLLYGMSTIYHALKPNRGKRVFRVFDHCSIYLLIAGTYTPYTLVTLRGGWGWALFAVVWSAAAVGIVLSAVSLKRFKLFGAICYLAMGWVIVVAAVPLWRALPPAGLWLLLGGGLFYTLGILFYRDKKHRYTHSVWHFFVLGGSVLHFISVLGYVLG